VSAEPTAAAAGPADAAGAADAPTGRRIRVIWNVSAGSKAGVSTNSTTAEQMRDLMSRHGLGGDLVESTSEEEARAAARDAVEQGFDVVVAAGGDGSVGLVAEELIGSEVALGVLPLGSVMNIARMLELPRDLEAAAAIIARGETRRIDVGAVAGRTFYESGSVGMNAAIFAEAQRFDKGEYVSLFRGLFVMLRYRPARMRIQLDSGLIRTRALMTTVSNGPYTGIGFTVAPKARLDDGLFDVRVFRHYSKLDLLRHFWSIAFGRRAYSPHVRTYRSRRVRIESAHPLPARADSIDLGTTPVEFEVRAGALKVICGDPPAQAPSS
jgi:diacylglycerol kinase (ATP)